MQVRTYPVIEGKAKPAQRLCKDCTPVEWIACYQNNGKGKQCDKQKEAAKSRI
jgi:hypothetical protein